MIILVERDISGKAVEALKACACTVLLVAEMPAQKETVSLTELMLKNTNELCIELEQYRDYEVDLGPPLVYKYDTILPGKARGTFWTAAYLDLLKPK